MRTETKANDVTIRRYEVDDLPKTAKNLDGFVMRIKAMRKRQTTKQHAYDMTAHMFLLTAYGWSHYPKSIYDELKWVPDLLANDEADEGFIAALQQVLCHEHYPGPQCQLPIVRDNLRKHYDISQEKADKVAEMLRNMQQRNLNTAKN